MNMLLDGIRVVDWTVAQVGPYASAMLADLGADVIKVEHRERGDLLRGLNPFLGVDTLVRGRQMNFEEHNRNKRGIALDLTMPNAVEVVHRLIKHSDVFLTNFRPPARLRLKLDYETVKQVNPNIIYASATGLGDLGPEAPMPSVDMLAQARSGAMFSAGEEEGPPVYSVPNLGDRCTSTALAFATVAALLGRERKGIAQGVEVSQLGAMVTLQGYWLMPLLLKGQEFRRASRTNPYDAMYNMYECQDGAWIVLSLFGRPGEWELFCQGLGRADLITDERFLTHEGRTENARALSQILEEVFASKPYSEWNAIFRSHDVLAQKVNHLSELQADPQVIANDIITEWNHPFWGQVKMPGFIAKFRETPAKFRMPAPELGQHTEEVLTEICGYSWDEVLALGEAGVI